jgi:DNA-binding beta-propeller fold protein YncE
MAGRKLLALAFLLAAPAAADILDIFSSDKLTDGSRFAFAPSRSDKTIIAIDVQDHEVAAVLELPHGAAAAVPTNELSLLVATHPENESVTVINLYNREIVRELDIGMRPDAVLANTYDRFVTFGSSDGSISTWDLSNFEQVLRVDGLSSGLLMTFSFDGSQLFVVEPRANRISVIDMAKRHKVSEISLGDAADANTSISALSRSADGYTGYVSLTSEDRLVIVDLVKKEVTGSIDVGDAPGRPYSTSDNRYVLIPNNGDQTLTVLSAWTRTIEATVPTGIQAREINTGWLDTVAFVMPASGNEIAVIDLQEFRADTPIELPGRSDDGIVTSDSKTLVAAIVDKGQVAIIDAQSRQLDSLFDAQTGSLEGIEIAISNNVCH